MVSSPWTKIRHGSVFRSNFTISTWQTKNINSQNPPELGYLLLMIPERLAEQTRWTTVNRPRQWQSFSLFPMNLLNYAPFWRGVQRTKKVRPTGKAFDDILTGHHGASQYGTSEMRNKTEEQDFRSHRWSKWGIIHPRHWTKVIIHSQLLIASELERYWSRHIPPLM